MDWTPPDTCANGHKLAPPNVKVAWVQCGCPRATGGPKGHKYVACTRCWWEWRQGGCDRPEGGQ